MSRLRQNFVTGKQGIGIAALGQTNHANNQRVLMTVDNSRIGKGILPTVDEKFLGDGIIKFKQYNSVKVDGETRATLSKIKTADGKTNISDINGMFIDGYVDVSADPWIMEIGATPNVVSTWMFLNKIGVPIKDIAYFMNQPIIRDYLHTIEVNGYSWLFIDNLVDEVKDLYQFKGESEIFEIPSTTALGEMIGKDRKEMDDVQKAQQQFMLDEFLKYAKMAEHLFHVTQGSNFDTANFNDPFLIFKKLLQLEKARKTIISSVDDLLNGSFVKELEEALRNIRNAYSEVLLSDRDSKDPTKISVRQLMEAVLLPYVDMQDREFIKISQKAVNDLFDWAVQTNTGLNTKVSEILLGKGTAKSAAKEIMQFVEKVKKDKEHPLNNNIIINSLREYTPQSGKKEGKADNLYIVGRDNKIYDQNQIIYAFQELRNFLGTEKGGMYGKLLRLAVIQSGLTNSPIAFTSLIPYEDFKAIYNETLIDLESIPNLTDFYNLHVFERNNWNNNIIIPYKKAQLRQSKKNKKYWFDPHTTFLNKNLKTAISNGEISKVINMSLYAPESKSDFIVFSWEDQISKEERAKRRKKGDTSHIHKGLFQKVYYEDSDGMMKPVIQEEEYKGKVYSNYVYKIINAWGDSYMAQEFYADNRPSVLDNDFVKAQKTILTETNDKKVVSFENNDDVISGIMRGDIEVAQYGSKLLKDQKLYFGNEINETMLKEMVYTQQEIVDIFEEIGKPLEQQTENWQTEDNNDTCPPF